MLSLPQSECETLPERDCPQQQQPHHGDDGDYKLVCVWVEFAAAAADRERKGGLSQSHSFGFPL